MNVDPNGNFAISALIIGILVTSLVCGTVSGISNVLNALGTGQDIGAAFIGGFISGAISGLGVSIGLAFGGIPGVFIAGFLGFAGGYLGSVVETGLGTGIWSWDDEMHLAKGAISAIVNMISFGIASSFMKEMGQQLTGSFIKRLTQALAPTMDSVILNVFYGGILGLSIGLAGILSHYISGGKYEQSIKGKKISQIYYMG